jgi:protocatechuate 3,4-dioxygenase beta subunit
MIGPIMRGLAAAIGVVIPLTMAPPQSRSVAFVLGRVVDAGTNRPIAGARVSLSPVQVAPGDASPLPLPADAGAANVLTGSDGRFLFRALAAGTYGLTASAPSYLPGGLGQQRPSGRTQPLVLAESQRVGEVTIRLWPEAAVSGVVVDESSAPVPGVWVEMLRRDRTVPPGQLPMLRGLAPYGARTDDQGRFRISAIEPGEYVMVVPSRSVAMPFAAGSAEADAVQSMRTSGAPDIGATSRGVRVGDSLLLTSYDGAWGGTNALAAFLPTTLRSDGRLVGYPATFHPSATTIEGATTLALEAGDHRTGIDIRMRPVTMTAVSGTVVGPDGPARHFAVHLIPDFAANSELERLCAAALTTTDAAGAFTFLGVPPGRYVMKAWRRAQGLVSGRDPPPLDTTLWAESVIAIGETPVKDVRLVLQPGGILSGRVRFEGTAAPLMPAGLQPPLSVAFEPLWSLAFGNRLGVFVAPSLEFATLGLPPGRYVVRLPNQFSASRGWFFESATYQGRDLTVVPIELNGERVSDITITFTDKRSEITGMVLDKTGRPDALAAVLIFPADHRSWIDQGLAPMAARSTLVTQAGTFAIPMRAGSYLVAAIDEETLLGWTKPGVIDAIARVATPVTLARGESQRVELRRGSR